MTLTSITPEAKANSGGRSYAVISGGHKNNYNVDMFNGKNYCMCEGLHGNFLVQLECFCYHAWIEYMHGWICVCMCWGQEWRAEVFHSKPGARVTAVCLRFIKTPGSPHGSQAYGLPTASITQAFVRAENAPSWSKDWTTVSRPGLLTKKTFQSSAVSLSLPSSSPLACFQMP